MKSKRQFLPGFLLLLVFGFLEFSYWQFAIGRRNADLIVMQGITLIISCLLSFLIMKRKVRFLPAFLLELIAFYLIGIIISMYNYRSEEASWDYWGSVFVAGLFHAFFLLLTGTWILVLLSGIWLERPKEKGEGFES